AMSQLIEDFLSVTGTTDQEVAKFFLESSDWNLELLVVADETAVDTISKGVRAYRVVFSIGNI
ncbi:hypothetical protein D917_09246, partial [Trichinella nativa]